MKYLGLLILLSLALIQCDEGDQLKRDLPGANGDPAELLIVLDDDFYTTSIKEEVVQLFTDTLDGYLALETRFEVSCIPRSKMDNFYRARHNILDLRLNPDIPKAVIEKKQDVFAARQLKINVTFTKFEELLRILNNSEELFKVWIDENEILARQYKWKKKVNKSLENQIAAKQDYQILVPRGAELIRNDADFLWIAFDQVDAYKVKHSGTDFENYTIDVIRGVIITERPYTSDTMLRPAAILRYRDQVMKQIPVLNDSAYMFTYFGAKNTFGKAYEPTYQEVNFNGQFGVEMQGIFRTAGATFGGQWVSVTTIDEARGKVVTIDSYLHCPNSEKRKYQGALKSWIYDLKFDEQVAAD